MSTVEVFDVGGRQAVRLPEEIRIDGDVVAVRREGNTVILEPVAASESQPEKWPEGFFDAIHINDPVFALPEPGILAPVSAIEPNGSGAVYISPRAYFRSVLAIAWSCFRHPFSTTKIDLVTGDVIPMESVG